MRISGVYYTTVALYSYTNIFPTYYSEGRSKLVHVYSSPDFRGDLCSQKICTCTLLHLFIMEIVPSLYNDVPIFIIDLSCLACTGELEIVFIKKLKII